MSAITGARAWLVDIDVEVERTDAVQSFAKQETVFVEVRTADGLTGTGYSHTIGTGGRALKVAHLAEAFHVHVCPHFLMELHVSLAAAVPHGSWVEHIPQLRAITTREVQIEGGWAVAPDEPALGIAWDRDRIEDCTVA